MERKSRLIFYLSRKNCLKVIIAVSILFIIQSSFAQMHVHEKMPVKVAILGTYHMSGNK